MMGIGRRTSTGSGVKQASLCSRLLAGALVVLLVTPLAASEQEEPAATAAPSAAAAVPTAIPITSPDVAGATSNTPVAAADASLPKSAAFAPPAPVALRPASGAAVIALDPAAQLPAKNLARQVYADASLRPRFSEKTAALLVGGEPTAGAAKQHDLKELLSSLAAVKHEAVRLQVLLQLAAQLNVQLLVVVSHKPRLIARVLRVSDQRFLALELAPDSTSESTAGAPHSWNDAAAMLSDLLLRPAPGPRSQTPRVPQAAAEGGGDDSDLLTSPWFWGGLGVVVSVGVTVLVLSQTTFKDADTVNVEGRIQQ